MRPTATVLRRILKTAASAALLLAPVSAPLADSHASAAKARPAARGGDFTLRASGGPVSLHDFRGKLVAIYFGYTFCPDACPTSLAALAAALKSLPAKQAAEVQPLFISVDPARDEPKRLADYAAFFHPRLLGVTGSASEVAAVAQAYGVFFRPQKVDSAGQYVVDHTSYIYLVGRQGELLQALPHGTPPPRIAAAITTLLAAP